MKKNLSETIKATIWISIFITPLFVLPITRDYFEINKMFLFYFLTLFLLSIWVSQSILEKKIIIKKSSIWLPIIILLFVWILSTIFSIHPYTSLSGNPWRFNGGLTSMLAFLIFLFIAVNTIDIEEINFYLKAILFSATIVAIIGILQYYSIINFIPTEARIGSTLGQANFLGSFLLIAIFITIYFILSSKKIWLKILYFSLICLPVFYSLILTGSRSAWAGAACGIIFIILMLLIFNYKKYLLVVIFISALCFLAFMPIAKQKYRQIDLRPEGTIYSRVYAWKGALKIAVDKPLLGTGPETFLYAFPKYRDPKLNYNYENWTTRFDKAHNEFLNLLATTGFLGLLSFLFLLYFLLKEVIKTLKKTTNFKTKILICCIIASLISLLIAISFGFLIVSTWLLFWFLIAILMICENKILGQNKYSAFGLNFLNNRIYHLIILTMISAFIILIGYYFGKIYLAEVYFSHGNNNKAAELNSHIDIYMGTLASEKGDPNLAQKAININPMNPDNWENYAQIEKDYLKIKEAMLEAQKLDPSNAKLYFELGQMANDYNDLDLAKSQLQKALELKNNYQEAKDLLSQILQSSAQKRKTEISLF